VVANPQTHARELLATSTRERRAADDDLDVGEPRRRDPGKGGRAADAGGEGVADEASTRPTVALPHVARYADATASEGGLAAAMGILDGRTGGRSLPPELAATLSQKLGIDLGQVVIHDDDRADQACAEIKARAFTMGYHIYFARGAYDPDSESGVELIAHEVAHVAQQARGTAPTRPGVSEPGDHHEVEADAFARQFRTERGSRYVAKAGDDPAKIVDFARREGRRVGLPFQQELEEQLGTSFDFVETYSGEAARLACEAMSASAMVIRNVIMLADPSPKRETLLHELTHVIQMGGGRAPKSFEAGSLKVSSRDDAAEVEARGGDAPSVSADANTIHRADPPKAEDDSSNRQKRIDYFIKNAKVEKFPQAEAGFEGEHHAFQGESPKTRYTLTSKVPWKREHYLDIVASPSSGLPAIKGDAASDDIKEMTSAANKEKNKIANVTDNTYAFIRSETWQAKVKHVWPTARPKADPDEQFECYFEIVKALPSRVGTLSWKSDAETLTAKDAVLSGADAESYRDDLRKALVAAYSKLPRHVKTARRLTSR